MAGVIFDMDGVLLDSMPVWDRAGELYLRQQNKTPEPGLREVLFTKSMMDAAEYIRTTYQIPKTQEAILEGIIDVVLQHYETDIPAKKGALSFVRQLREHGIPVVVATSSDRVLAQAGLSRLGFLQYVERIFTCRESGSGKEEPAVYLDALAYLGGRPEETWVFEDSLHALRTANRAGFLTAALYDESSQGNQEQLRREATVYLGDLRDFEAFYQLAGRSGKYGCTARKARGRED